LVLDLGIAKETITLGDSTLLKLNPNFAVNKISWKPDDYLSCDTCMTTYAFPKDNATYEVTAIDANGCEARNSVALTVKYVKNVFIPNAFNPNGKSNSMFTIYGNPLIVKRVVSFQIYDRWGTLVHENFDFAPNLGSWDGSFRNEPCNSAVFVYYGDIEFYDGTVRRVSGDVTLLR
jgi:gliding motility-associated-like protein